MDCCVMTMLLAYMCVSSDIRPYKCNFCDYYARTNSQLKVHMMRHQGNHAFLYLFVIRLCVGNHFPRYVHVLLWLGETVEGAAQALV